MIMVTHNLKQASRLGNRGLYIMGDKLMEDGSIPQMLEKPTTRELEEFLED